MKNLIRKILREERDKDWDFMDDITIIPRIDNWSHTEIYFNPLPDPKDWLLVAKVLEDDEIMWYGKKPPSSLNPFAIWKSKTENELTSGIIRNPIGVLNFGNKDNLMSQRLDTLSSISGHNEWLREKKVNGNEFFGLK